MSKLKGYKPNKGDTTIALVASPGKENGMNVIQTAEPSPRDAEVPGVVESGYDAPGTGSSTIPFPAQGY